MMRRIVILFVGILVSFQYLEAQQNFNVTLIYNSQQQDSSAFQNSMKSEIESLLGPEYKINFTELFTNGDFTTSRKFIDNVYHSNSAGILIGVGPITSRILSEKKTFLYQPLRQLI